MNEHDQNELFKSLGRIETDINEIKKTLEYQAPLIESWKFTQKNAIMFLGGFAFLVPLIASFFQGCLNYLIHK
jgi:hypothetical protein